ncbi:hypothetical protein KP509_22G016800 [Ceratopteris richardii]|uniref:Uncharacterized protein n=1 Tax=Ceratopteris richardii TaxID=49495 RepID=A0A8T2S2Y9_CERRI|nr:hypothetical protein KP509_22G016800 [Ceratopteris richardii]
MDSRLAVIFSAPLDCHNCSFELYHMTRSSKQRNTSGFYFFLLFFLKEKKITLGRSKNNGGTFTCTRFMVKPSPTRKMISLYDFSIYSLKGTIHGTSRRMYMEAPLFL